MKKLFVLALLTLYPTFQLCYAQECRNCGKPKAENQGSVVRSILNAYCIQTDPTEEFRCSNIEFLNEKGKPIDVIPLSGVIYLRVQTAGAAKGDFVCFEYNFFSDRQTNVVAKVGRKGEVNIKIDYSLQQMSSSVEDVHIPPKFKHRSFDSLEQWVDHKLKRRKNSEFAELDDTIQFEYYITKDGKVERVWLVSIPPNDLDLVLDAYDLLMNSPGWEPALNENGEPVSVWCRTSFKYND